MTFPLCCLILRADVAACTQTLRVDTPLLPQEAVVLHVVCSHLLLLFGSPLHQDHPEQKVSGLSQPQIEYSITPSS